MPQFLKKLNYVHKYSANMYMKIYQQSFYIFVSCIIYLQLSQEVFFTIRAPHWTTGSSVK